jgi:hypothetical protein
VEKNTQIDAACSRLEEQVAALRAAAAERGGEVRGR